MAEHENEVFTTETVTLLDGTDVELRPLPISRLRKFTRTWSQHIAAMSKLFADNVDADETVQQKINDDMTDAQYDVFIKLSALCLETQLKEPEEKDKDFSARLEEILDEQTIARILERCGGLKLSENPNQLNPESNPGDGMN